MLLGYNRPKRVLPPRPHGSSLLRAFCARGIGAGSDCLCKRDAQQCEARGVNGG